MGHEPDKCRDIFVPWMKSEGAEVVVSDTLDSYTQLDLKNDFDLIVQAWTMGTIKTTRKRPFLQQLRQVRELPGGTEESVTHSGTTPNTSSW